MKKDESEVASEYLFQNIFNARIASSKKELAEKLGYPENEFNRIFNMDKIDIDIYYPDFKFKLRKIIPDFNMGWWRKGNKSKEYHTESGLQQLHNWQNDFRCRLSLAIEHAVGCGFFTSTKDFEKEFFPPKKEIVKQFDEIYNTLAHLKRRIPNLNTNWLLTGDGGMLDAPLFLDPLRFHIEDVIKNQFYLQQRKIIRLSAKNILYLVRRQYLRTHYDKITEHVFEYPDSVFYIKGELKKMGFKEESSEDFFGYCEYIAHPIIISDEKAKKGYILKAEDWFEEKEMDAIFRENIDKLTEK